MIRALTLLSLAGVFACSGDKTGDTATDTVTNTCPDGADITISSTYPASGAADFYIMGAIEFSLSAADPSASLALTGPDGAVAGSSAVNGTKVVFTPDAALSPSTNYTASLTYCNSATPVDIGFTTSALGSALTVDLVGKTYAVDLASGNFVEPPGIGSLLGGLFENNILLGITSADTQLHILGAISAAGNTDQDFCTETLNSFPAADFSNSPYFEIPEGDVTLTVAGFTATIHGLSVAGTFAADGSYFGGGELSGQLDAREIVDLVSEAGLDVESADDVCGLIQGFGVSCSECSDGTNYCVTLEVNRLVANETGVTLTPVCASDCHESCSTNADTCTVPQAVDAVCE